MLHVLFSMWRAPSQPGALLLGAEGPGSHNLGLQSKPQHALRRQRTHALQVPHVNRAACLQQAPSQPGTQPAAKT